MLSLDAEASCSNLINGYIGVQQPVPHTPRAQFSELSIDPEPVSVQRRSHSLSLPMEGQAQTPLQSYNVHARGIRLTSRVRNQLNSRRRKGLSLNLLNPN